VITSIAIVILSQNKRMLMGMVCMICMMRIMC